MASKVCASERKCMGQSVVHLSDDTAELYSRGDWSICCTEAEILTLEDIPLLDTKLVTSCEEADAGPAEYGSCDHSDRLGECCCC